MSVFRRIARLLASFRTRYFTITSLVALGIGSGLGLLVNFRPDLIPSEPPVALDLFVDYWVAAVKVVVTPLIVAYLIVAIVSIGTAGETGKLGGITLLVHTALALGGLALALLASKYFIPLSDSNVEQLRPILNQIAVPDNPGAGPYRASFWDTAIAHVWANPVTAIREGRIVPLLLWTLGLAFVLRSLRTSLRARIVGFFETVVDLGQLVVAALLLFMPVVVCGFLFTLVAKLGLEVLGAVAFYIVGVSAVTALYTIVLYLLMPIAAGIRVRDFAKSLVPSQLVAIGSRSSLACMPTLIEAAETRLRLSRPVVEFVLPLSISTMKVSRTV
ncbi:MAG TPA: cation:dicarboxylase symporter family transporter, partial [Rhodothermia bacterium]